jgi:hypothetical protein
LQIGWVIGGSKNSQKKDIERAKEYLEEFQARGEK